MTNGTLSFFLKLEKDTAVTIYEAKLKKYDEAL